MDEFHTNKRRKNMKIPFTTLNEHLKYIRFSSIDLLGKLAMKFAFSEFYEDELENLEGKQNIKNIKFHGLSEVDEAPFRYRRFSGGINLPRGRYYSISNSNGDDSKTLVQELSSYVNPKKSGQILIHDTFLNQSIENSKVGSKKYLIVEFIDSNKPNPFISHLVENGKLSQRKSKSIPLPYSIEEVTIPNIIDLRYPKTQKWLYEAVTDCLPGIGYYYSPNFLVSGLVINEERPQENNFNPLMKEDGGSGKLYKYPPNQQWDGVVRDGPKNFFGLLPFLIYPGRGGSPITDAIGRWLPEPKS